MYLTIIMKTVFLYFFVMIIYRWMGKKEIGQLSVVDLIITLMIAELAAISIENKGDSIFLSLVPIFVLASIEIFISYLGMKNVSFKKFVDGNPSVIINKGKLNFNMMNKIRYTIEDLISQLREQGIKSIEEVDYAVLENNGKLSVFKNNSDYPMPFIIDGRIDYAVLTELKKDMKWLNQVLLKEKLEIKNIFYAFYTKDKIYFIKKSEL